ncbi:DUF4352 domain-containing protein [Streptomyces sp. NPDC046984]|uniref:DUF4352 domain-containing protein n=1 Tax=Streptomyces sp. NPDC046984 TaxID=3155138 RepID=UPI0033F8A9DF
MKANRAISIALLVAATATACSSSETPAPSVTVTKTVTATPSTEAAPAANDGVLKMGTTKAMDNDEDKVHITVQAVEYQQPYKGPQPQKPEDFQGGDTWATLNVKICNTRGDAISVSPRPWSLAYADDTSIESTGLSGGDMPKPEFPMDKIVKPGRCAAGLIAFPVPSSKRPERIVYGPDDSSDPIEWAVPKA